MAVPRIARPGRERARKELRFHGRKRGKGQGTQDQGFWVSVEDSTLPLYKFGTNIPQKATQYKRIQSHLHPCPLNLSCHSFPRRSKLKTSGQLPPTSPFEILLLVSAQALSPTAPSICSSVQLASFSPTCPCNPFPVSSPPPSTAPFLQLSQSGRGGRSKKVKREGWSDPEMGRASKKEPAMEEKGS